jgi:hypothetical protein
LTPVYEDEFEPLTDEEEAELIASFDRAEEDLANGRTHRLEDVLAEIDCPSVAKA